MNIIPQPAAFRIEERITTATGNDREQAFKLLTEKVHANAPAYAPGTGIRLVLLGGDQ